MQDKRNFAIMYLVVRIDYIRIIIPDEGRSDQDRQRRGGLPSGGYTI
ncbi:MAG: hypothetical protein ACYS9C_15400 [Planctomycetota bacterium]